MFGACTSAHSAARYSPVFPCIYVAEYGRCLGRLDKRVRSTIETKEAANLQEIFCCLHRQASPSRVKGEIAKNNPDFCPSLPVPPIGVCRIGQELAHPHNGQPCRSFQKRNHPGTCKGGALRPSYGARFHQS